MLQKKNEPSTRRIILLMKVNVFLFIVELLLKVDFFDIIPLENDAYDQTLEEIQQITQEVFDVGLQLMMSPDQTVYNEYDMNMKHFNARKKESVQLLRLFYYFDNASGAAKSGEGILTLIKQSEKLIKDNPSEFQKYQENWNKYNQRLKEEIAFTTFMTKKGAKVRKVLFGSIFLFLTFDNPISRRQFIDDFYEGEIESEAQRILITEDFLRYFHLQTARVELTIEDGDDNKFATGEEMNTHSFGFLKKLSLEKKEEI